MAFVKISFKFCASQIN